MRHRHRLEAKKFGWPGRSPLWVHRERRHALRLVLDQGKLIGFNALGILQRYFSRFRITTNGGQCISCGNCSTYCEMGIDVRRHARRGANVVRASCVGCGICSAVCPRGVLNLDGGKTHKDRFPGADQPLAEFIRSLRS